MGWIGMSEAECRFGAESVDASACDEYCLAVDVLFELFYDFDAGGLAIERLHDGRVGSTLDVEIL